jgi:uncharacterized beta-barrel protein YwiB (DUF1934 family)
LCTDSNIFIFGEQMKKNVKITLLSEQTRADEKDSAKQRTTGTLEKRENGDYIIEYTEPDAEMGKSFSCIQVEGCKKVLLKREGLYQTHFTIEQGKAHKTLYRTPYGEMELEVYGKKVDATLNAEGGSVYLFYSLTSNGQPISENKLIINIKSQK